MDKNHKKNAKIFKAFCDPNRLAVLELLQSGEKCACVLLEKLDVTQSGLSYHMKILCESGIVNGRQDGKWMHYSINEKGRIDILQLLSELTKPDIGADVETRECQCEKK